MTKGEGKGEVIDLKGLLAHDEDFVRAAVEALVQAALQAEMTAAIGAEKGERTETRLSYRSGHYSRSLITRSAAWNCGCHRTGWGGSRPNCSSAISARRRAYMLLSAAHAEESLVS
jgi:hypothetical protein